LVKFFYVRVEVSTAVTMKNGVFWDPDEGDAKVLRNVGSYKSHTV
jgi:hypothetical protein